MKPFFENSLLDAFYGLYLNTIGEYEFTLENFQGSSDDHLFVLLGLATFLLQITFLNMLISIMSNTYDMVSEKRNASMMRERISILCEYRAIL